MNLSWAKRFIKKEYQFIILKINQSFFYYAFLRWVKHIFKADIHHIKVHHRKLDRPVIVVSNHVSGWDPFLIFSVMHRKFFFNHLIWRLPAFYGHFYYPHKWLLFKFLGVYPIKPVRITGSLEKSLEKTVEIIKSGHNIIFFPEGKRVASHEQVRPKRGIAHIIKKNQAYILPVYIDYYKGRKEGRLGVKLTARVRVFIGETFPTEYFLKNYSEEQLHEAVMEHIKKLPEKFNIESTKSFSASINEWKIEENNSRRVFVNLIQETSRKIRKNNG